MQPQQKMLPRSYYLKMTGCILICVLYVGIMIAEIIDIFHPIDIVPVSPFIYAGRLIFTGLILILTCIFFKYFKRFERDKVLGRTDAYPRWFLFLNRWPVSLKRWTFIKAVSIFICPFILSVIWQTLFPITETFDAGWVFTGATLFASMITFSIWINFRRQLRRQEQSSIAFPLQEKEWHSRY